MNWLAFASIAAVAFGIRRLINRHVMKTESPYSYALVDNILTSP